MAAATEQVTKKDAAIPAFGIEADTERNGDLLIQCIPGLRLRGRLNGAKPSRDFTSGAERVNPDQAAMLGILPIVPGVQLHVNPKTRTYAVIDPCNHDPELAETISKRLREMGKIPPNETVQFEKDREGTLDVDRMKTLCREMVNSVKAGHATFCKGPVITLEDCDDLPGEYLLNPGLTAPSTQPRYEKDYEDWCRNLDRK